MSNACDVAWGLPEVQALFDELGLVGAMLEFEAALAKAQGDLGLIQRSHAQTIVVCCAADAWSEAQARELIRGSIMAGSLAIPLIQALRQRVASRDADAAAAVHFGATSQDVIDTAMVLQLRRALALIQADIAASVEAIRRCIQARGHQPVLARTLMQPASVVSLSHRLLSWLLPLQRCGLELERRSRSALRLQLGGAVGTLAAWGDKGPALAQALTAHWGLEPLEGSWHTQRDEAARLASELGVLCGSIGKVGRDLALLSQAEVGEVQEAFEPGRGGSSAMPHKRNPVGALVAIAAAQRAPHKVAAILACMQQEQERSLGLWQAELAEWCSLVDISAGAARVMSQTLPHLQWNADRMAAHVRAFAGPDLQQAQALADQAHAQALQRLQSH